jgi:acetate---CoA ligase (ADP-forming)
MTEAAPDLELSQRKVAALTAPRNVVVVGASDRPASWAARVWQNLEHYGYLGTVYPVNPRRAEIWGRACYPSVAALPEAPDHLVILVPAEDVIGVLRDGAAKGARSATIFSAGFGEASDEAGRVRGAELRRAIAETGIAVSGPNCMGNFCGKSRLVTLSDTRGTPIAPGPVALVG